MARLPRAALRGFAARSALGYPVHAPSGREERWIACRYAVSTQPIQNRRPPLMLLTDAFTIFPQRRKDGLEKQRTLWSEDESSWNVMHPYQSAKGNPRARRTQKNAPARHPKRMSTAIFLRPSTGLCPGLIGCRRATLCARHKVLQHGETEPSWRKENALPQSNFFSAGGALPCQPHSLAAFGERG